MSSKFTPSGLSVKKLDDRTDLSSFNCNENDELKLDEFIHDEALNLQKGSMGTTYLFYNEDKVVGYVTILMSCIGVNLNKPRSDTSRHKLRKLHYPALYLAKIAVENRFRRRYIGKLMLFWCIGFALKLSEEIGCRFIFLVTKGESRVKFYHECGFQESSFTLKKKTGKEEWKMMYFQLV